MKKRILSVVLALCLCISSHSVAFAQQEEASPQGEGHAPEPMAALAASDAAVPSPADAYEAMIALKDQDAYKEGTPWTNDEPYSDAKGYYRWKGGTLDGVNIVAVGCVAFAFILSDAAFGSLPARMYAPGGFKYEDIKPGDILRVNDDTHTLIVLEADDAGVVVAEGNISIGDHKGKVHWGRAISKEEVMSSTSHYITRYPEGYVSPDDPAANQIIGSGTLNGGLAWKLTKAGTLTVSGNGTMPDYSSAGEQPWNTQSSQIRKVVIENGVTNIGSCAFWNCGVLSAEIPDSVTSIGNSAFRESSIISVTVPSSVKTIGDSAFQNCKNLSSVTVSDGVETINQNAFHACESLTSIALPASIGEVGAAAFFQCTKLASATFAPGSKQVKMGDNMFTRCYYLINVTLPKSIDRISNEMFQNCLMLAGIEVPQDAEKIGDRAFASCNSLTTIIIPDSVTQIGIAAFSDCSLSDIYFTGTEAQWNSVGKIGDTQTALSSVTKHYNYVPTTDDDSDQGNGGGNDSDQGNGGGTGDGDNSGTGGTQTPGTDNDKPNGGDNSGNGSNPGGSNTPEDSDTPENNTSISGAAMTLSQTSYVYDGTPKTPSVTVTLNGKALVLDTDYTVSYSDNINEGTAKVTVTGKGDYTGSMTATFTITKATEQNPAISVTCEKTMYKVAYGAKPFKINASSAGRMTFSSSRPKVAAVDKDTGKVTIKNTGIATITVKAGAVSQKVTIRVNPKKQSVKAAKAEKGKKLTVKWTKDKMASGYQVQVSTDKKFKKNVKSKNLSKASYTFKKLKKGSKYYVRVRSYKKSGHETLYGTWSKIKVSNKIKK